MTLQTSWCDWMCMWTRYSMMPYKWDTSRKLKMYPSFTCFWPHKHGKGLTVPVYTLHLHPGSGQDQHFACTASGRAQETAWLYMPCQSKPCHSLSVTFLDDTEISGTLQLDSPPPTTTTTTWYWAYQWSARENVPWSNQIPAQTCVHVQVVRAH